MIAILDLELAGHLIQGRCKICSCPLAMFLLDLMAHGIFVCLGVSIGSESLAQ